MFFRYKIIEIPKIINSYKYVISKNNIRKFGNQSKDHSHHDLHVPEFYDKLGKFCLTFTFFWIFYRFKENNGQIFVIKL